MLKFSLIMGNDRVSVLSLVAMSTGFGCICAVCSRSRGGQSVQNFKSSLHPENPRRVIRLRAVATDKNAAVTAITIQRAAEFSDVSRRFPPARRLRVKLSKFLELEILFFRQKLNAHGRSYNFDCVTSRQLTHAIKLARVSSG